MTILIAVLAIVFIVLTFMVVSKTQSILKDLSKSEVEESEYLGAPDRYNSANGVGLFAFWLISVIGIVWSFMVYKKDFLPEASSIHGKETDYWFWVSMIVIMIGFFIVNTFLFLFSFL